MLSKQQLLSPARSAHANVSHVRSLPCAKREATCRQASFQSSPNLGRIYATNRRISALSPTCLACDASRIHLACALQDDAALSRIRASAAALRTSDRSRRCRGIEIGCPDVEIGSKPFPTMWCQQSRREQRACIAAIGVHTKAATLRPRRPAGTPHSAPAGQPDSLVGIDPAASLTVLQRPSESAAAFLSDADDMDPGAAQHRQSASRSGRPSHLHLAEPRGREQGSLRIDAARSHADATSPFFCCVPTCHRPTQPCPHVLRSWRSLFVRPLPFLFRTLPGRPGSWSVGMPTGSGRCRTRGDAMRD